VAQVGERAGDPVIIPSRIPPWTKSIVTVIDLLLKFARLRSSSLRRVVPSRDRPNWRRSENTFLHWRADWSKLIIHGPPVTRRGARSVSVVRPAAHGTRRSFLDKSIAASDLFLKFARCKAARHGQ
jgi:hypothetical protein